MTYRTRSITALASTLMSILSVIVAVSFPAGYYIIQTEAMDGRAESEAAYSAREVESLIQANPKYWQYEEIRLSEVLNRRLNNDVPDRRWIRDIYGNVAAQTGGASAGPVRKYRKFIYDGGDPVAIIEIERSVYSIIRNTALISLLSVGFSLLIFFYFRFAPLRAVRTAYEIVAENERRLSLAVESGKFGVWEWNLKNDSMIWNDRMFEIYGAERASARVGAEKWKACVHPEDRDRVWDEARPANNGKGGFHSEFRIVRPDGTVRHIEANGLIVSDSGGRPETLVCINDDVTESRLLNEALKKSEEYFRALTESASDILFIVDKGGIIKYVSPSSEWTTGYRPHELIGTSAFLIFTPEDLPRAIEDFGAALLTENVALFNSFNIRHKNGTVMILEGFGKNLLNDPVISGFVMNVRDVTARRQTETALRQSEEKYRTIIESMEEGCMELDLKGRVTFANKAAGQLLGYGGGELQGLHYSKYLSGSNAAEVQELFKSLFRTKIPVHFEGEAIRKDGSAFAVDGSAHLILNAEGQPTGFRGLFRDITDRKLAEERLKESERRLANIIEFLPDATFAIDLKGCIIAWNKALEMMTGIKAEAVLGKGNYEHSVHLYGDRRPILADLVLNPDPEAQNRYERLTRKGEVLSAEVHSTAAGTYYSSTAVTLRDSDGNVIGAIQSIRDITERKLLETRLVQAQKMEAMGTLAGGIAHDFNNILSVIIGYTEIARSKLTNADMEGLLQNVLRAGDRAKSLIKQILTFSRRTDQKKRPVDLSIIVKEALKLLRPTIPSSIEIQQEIDSTLSVMADPTQIHQVLMNLCANSAHAMRDKGGVLGVFLHDCFISKHSSVSPDLPPGSYVKLTVFDTGAGIKPDDLDRIFDPFFTTKPQGEGTGLGLSMVYGIVRECKGAILVNSAPGEGTSFEIYIPGIGEEGKSEAPEEVNAVPGGNERILFVDDEPDVARMAKEMIQMLGYSIYTETSSIKALEDFRSNPRRYDLVITDMTMPGMTGKDLAKELLKVRPGLPIIMCTGYSETVSKEEARQIGISEFRMKPVSMRNMAEAIRSALGKRS